MQFTLHRGIQQVSKGWRVEDFFDDRWVQDQTKHPFRFWLELKDDFFQS